MNSVLQLSPLIQFLLVFSVFGLVGFLGPALVRRQARGLAHRDHHEVLGLMFSVAAAFYGVVLAFVIVAAWQNFQDAAQREQVEVLALTELYAVASRMPPVTRQAMLQALRGYVNDSLAYEWSNTAGAAPRAGRGDMMKMLNALFGFEPLTTKEGLLYGKALDEMTRLFEARQARILYSQSNIPAIVWTVIIFGAGVTIALSFFFFTQHRLLQAVTSMLFAMLIGLTVVAIYDLSHPYQGYTRIAPTGFRDLIREIDTNFTPAAPPAAALPPSDAPAR